MTQQRMRYAGIDAGGTKTRLAFKQVNEDSSQEIVYRDGPGINLTKDGQAHAIATIEALMTSVLDTIQPQEKLVLYAGIAGAGRKEACEALEAGLEAAFAPHSPLVKVETDAALALYAAHKAASGLLLIVGTGSIIMARTHENSLVRTGGWGRLLGDEAGGYRLGQAALAAVANAMDGGPQTQLVQDVAASFAIDTPDKLINFAHAPHTQIQRIAPLVLKAAAANDEVALELVNQQLNLLVDRLAWLLEKHDAIEQRMTFIGGLSQNRWFRKTLLHVVRVRFPQMVFVEPARSPADAALELAYSLPS